MNIKNKKPYNSVKTNMIYKTITLLFKAAERAIRVPSGEIKQGSKLNKRLRKGLQSVTV